MGDRRLLFFNFVSGFLLSHNHQPLEKDVALHLKKLNPLNSIKDVLCHVWLKLAQWFWRRTFFLLLSMYFRYFVIISPWKRLGPSFEQTWIPFTLNENGPVVLEKMKMWKVYYGQTNSRRTPGDQKSSLELSGQVS